MRAAIALRWFRQTDVYNSLVPVFATSLCLLTASLECGASRDSCGACCVRTSNYVRGVYG